MTLFERIRFRFRILWFALSARPVAGGEGEAEGDEGGEAEGEGESKEAGEAKAEAGAEASEAEGEEEGEAEIEPEAKDSDYWKRKFRKEERARKKWEVSSKDKDEALKKRDDERKSAEQKALDKAKEEGRKEVRSEVEIERRQDRLESAVVRAATRGIDISIEEDGETVTRRAKFADPDDALVHLERSISRGEVDGDDIFNDEGRVQREPLAEALSELLEQKPHLRMQENGGEKKQEKQKPQGSSEAGGRGLPEGDKEMEELSADEHFKSLRKGS